MRYQMEPRPGLRVRVIQGVDWPREPVNWDQWGEPIQGQTGRVIDAGPDDFIIRWDDYNRLGVWEYSMRIWRKFEIIDDCSDLC